MARQVLILTLRPSDWRTAFGPMGKNETLGLANCENNPPILPESWETAFEPRVMMTVGLDSSAWS